MPPKGGHNLKRYRWFTVYVMPAYNEEANIENTVRQWYPILDGKGDNSKLVVADSGSTDRTHEILEWLRGNGFSNLEILTESDKQHGPKLIALYDYAIKRGADYIFQTDSDGQTDPNEFKDFWDLRKTYQGIFGNRTVRGDGKQRAFVEKVVCFLLKLFFGINVPDANAPFRLMQAETVKQYLYRLDSSFNLPNIMLVTFFVRYNEMVEFLPISFKPRQGGKNSINIRKIIRIGCKALKDFYYFRRDMRRV